MTNTVTVTTWSLEQTSPADLVPSAGDPGPEVRIVRAQAPSPEFSRFLYASVGADCSWTDRLSWTYGQWEAYLNRPVVETWVAYDRGTPAGYIELEGQPKGQVEIAYFGLLPAFRGRRIGGRLLSFGIGRAWEMTGTERVWVHTCSLDGPHALANYEKRGFRIFDVKTGEEEKKSDDLSGSGWASPEWTSSESERSIST
jgi:ribosomal protein S18 acetylase RimI-like enzyme